MFAVVDIAGQQFNVEENTKYYVPRLSNEVDSKVTFDSILLFSDGKKTKIGDPTVKGMKVTAKVLEHVKDDKVIVFKKKRRKSYRIKNGHRQQLTRIEVTKISAAKAPTKAKVEKAEKVEAEKVEESK
ncbi:MAG: 50S ribosomal protein L21 [Chlorobi bacterium]|nr:50S ribosomal protein L21 [Chlorobiota bacterium]